MIRSLIAFLAVGLTTLSIAQVNIEDIQFKRKHLNLGNIYLEGGIVPAIYKFTNTSDKVFNITSMEAACGCTKPETNKKTYLPGESGEIVIQFNPKGMIGQQEKWVYIRGNFANAFQIELDFKANVMAGETRDKKYYRGEFGYLMLEKYEFNWGKRTNDDQFYDTILVFNDGYNDITVNSFKNLPSYIIPVGMPVTIAPGDTLPLVFDINLTKTNKIGPVNGVVKLMSTDRFYPMKEFKYYYEVYPNYAEWSKRKKKKAAKLTIVNSVVDMGEVKSGSKVVKTVTLRNDGKQDLLIKRVEADCSCTLAKLPKKIIEPGEEMQVEVTFDSLFKEGLKRKVVTLYTNDPSAPRQTFIVQADVQ